MKWFLIKTQEGTAWPTWDPVEAEEKPAGAVGPFDTHDEAERESADLDDTERGCGVKDVFEKLVLMIAKDSHVLISSRIKRPVAHHVLVLIGKEPKYQKKIVKLLLMELADQIPQDTTKPKWGASWNCLTALYDILGKDIGPVVPEDHRGKIRELSKDWIEWGEDNGYSIGS